MEELRSCGGCRKTVISCCLCKKGRISKREAGKERRKEDVLEVSSVLLVNEDQVEVVAGGELFVDVAEGWSELEATEEESDGDRFACGVGRG